MEETDTDILKYKVVASNATSLVLVDPQRTGQ